MGNDSSKLDKQSSNKALTEALYRTIYENCLDGMMLTEPDGSILSANPQACRMFGMTEEEIIAARRDGLVVADEVLVAALKEREQKRMARAELIYRRRDGTTFIGETASCTFTDADGSIKASTIIRDITERKHAETALKESEERLRLTIDAVNDGIWEWNLVTGDAVLSPRWYTMLGYKPYELPQNYDTWRSLVNPDDIDRAEQEINGHIPSGEGYAIEIRMQAKSGDWKWILTRGKVVERDAYGHPVRMVGTHSDISERKMAEELTMAYSDLGLALASTRSLGEALKLCVDAAARISGMDCGGAYIVDDSGDLRLAYSRELSNGFVGNASLYEAGSERWKQVMAGKPIYASSKDLPKFQETVCDKGLKAAIAIPLVHKGKVIGCINAGSRTMEEIPDASRSALESMIAQVENAIARLKAEEALRESEEKFRAMADSAQASITLYQDGRIVYANQASEIVFGYTLEERARLKFWEVIHPDCREKVVESMSALLTDAPCDQQNEYRIIRKDGQERWIFSSGSSFTYCGKPAVIIAAVDITERKSSEKALQESESFLNSIIDQSPLAIWISDDRGTLIRINQACQDLLQISEDEVLGRYNIFNDNIVEEQGFMPLVRRVFEAGETARFEIKYDSSKIRDLHLARSTSVNLVVTIFPVRDPSGKIINAVIQHIDATERKKAENCLKDSEERYHKLFEVESDALFLVDCESRNVIDANPAALRMYGHTREEMLGMNICDISVHPDKTLLAIEDREKYIPLRWHRRKDGTVFPVEIACSYFEFQGCQVLVAAIRDITVRKGFEAKLKHSESRYRSLFKHSPIATLEEDFSKVTSRFDHLRSSGISDFREYFRSHPEEVPVLASMVKILDANQTGMEFFRVSDMGYIPASQSAYFIESSWKVFTEELVSLAEGSTSFEDEISIQLPSGESKIAYLNLSVVPGCESTLSRVLVSLVDITDRKRMDAIILDQLEFLQQLLDAIPAPLFYKDRRGVYMGCNRAFESYLGQDRSDIVGMSVYDLSPRDLADKYHEMDMELLENPGAQVYESSVLYADGTRHDVIFNKATYNRADGSTAGLIGIILDITERKKAEQVREELLRDLEFKNAELERFVYTVSHELRSPLITVSGFVDLLKLDLQNGSTERIDADLNIIRSAVAKMDQLLRDTLELSRIGRVANPPANISLGEVAGEVLSLLEEQIRARGAQVDVSLDLPSAYADRMRIVEVLTNLIENSIKYMGDQPQPRIEIGYRQSCGAFYVKDNGIGIHPSQHHKIFELFYKVDRKSDGTGVGLAIVKRIIDVHGGHIWIESDPGDGCTVCFSLPVSAGNQADLH